MKLQTSKERILATVRRQPVDHLPLCFEGICHGITRFVHDQCLTPRQRVRFYLDREIDVALSHSPPAISTAGFTTRSRQEALAGEKDPLLIKEYITADGTLRQVIRYTPDYDVSRVHGAQKKQAEVRMFADENVPPDRSQEYLVSRREHLPALRRILQPISGAARDGYLREMREAKAFCVEQGVLLGAYLPGVGDPLIWMSGVEPLLTAAMDDMDFVAEYVGIVADWNRANLELMLEGGAEYIVRRGWYETVDFWSPALYRQLLLKPLQAETRLARQAGALYAYCMNSGIMPLVDALGDSGIDVLCNIDPAAPLTNLPTLKARLGGKITLCGGVNNQHVLERGTVDQVRQAVSEAVSTLASGGGFILAPGDSILETDETARGNFAAMVEAWKELRLVH